MGLELPSEYKSNADIPRDYEIDLLQMLLDLKERWKTLFGATFLGALLAVAIALAIPKVYQARAQVTLPSDADIVALNEHSLISLGKQQLFERYYQKLNSTNNFVEFLTINDAVKELFPDSKLAEELIAARLADKVSIEILEPAAQKREVVQNPTKVEINLSHKNEPVLVKTVNDYIQFTATRLLTELEAQSQSIRDSRLASLERQLGLLREDAKQARLRQIAVIEERNQEELSKLEQQMQLIVEKAKNDRLVEIAKIEEENSLKLENLTQQYQLVLERSKKDRATQIAEAQEALKIAKELDITLPTPVSDFRAMKGEGASTNINVTDNPSLPLYLMGTRYLISLVESLKNRESDELFSRELNKISIEIDKVKNDKKLELLKAKEDDRSTIVGLNEVKKQIAAIKDDKVLEALKNRTSDDNYIDALPGILAEIRKLEAHSFHLDGVKPMTVAKSAVIRGIAVKPNRPLIAISGTILSGILAVFLVLISASFKRKSLK